MRWQLLGTVFVGLLCLGCPNKIQVSPHVHHVQGLEVKTPDPGLTTPFYLAGEGRVAAVPSSLSPALATEGDGRTYAFVVADARYREIRFYDTEGLLIRKFSVTGTPMGVAIKSSGELFIPNRDRGCVEVYSWNGAFLRRFGSLKRPGGLDLSEKLNLLAVVDSEANEVQVYDLSRETEVRAFGSRSATLAGGTPRMGLSFGGGTSTASYGKLRFPVDVCILEGERQFVVCDFLDGQLEFFNLQGRPVRTVEQKGGSQYPFERPMGVFADSSQKVYLVDVQYHRVYVFQKDGSFVKVIGKYGTGVGELRGPTDAAILTDGRLIVLSPRNQTIEVFLNY